MTPWLVLAAAVLVFVPGSVAARRTQALALSGRLACATTARPTGGSSTTSTPRWSSRAARRTVGAGCAAGAAVVGAAIGGPAIACVAGLAGVTAWTLALRVVDDRSAGRERDHTLRAVRLVVAEFEAGAAPAVALHAAAAGSGRCASAFAAAALAAGHGADPSVPLIGAGGALAATGHALRVGERTGAPLAAVLGRVAADLVADRDQQRQVAVALAGPRSSAVLVAALPALGMVLGAAMGADPLHFLLGTGGGRAVATAGVLLDLAGVWWIAALLRRARRA